MKHCKPLTLAASSPIKAQGIETPNLIELLGSEKTIVRNVTLLLIGSSILSPGLVEVGGRKGKGLEIDLSDANFSK